MYNQFNKVVIHQPDFLPYIGFFDRLKLAAQFVILDHVQLSKSGWTHRDKILTDNGVEWLTIPVIGIKKNPLIKDAIIAHGKEYDKVSRKIYHSYKTAPYFKLVYPLIEEILNRKPDRLVDLNTDIIRAIIHYLNIDVSIVFSSTLGVKTKRSEMNAEITQLCGGSTYISGMGAKDYHIDEPFIKRGLKVEWRSFKPFEYPQSSNEFIANLSILDVIMNLSRWEVTDHIGQ